MTLADAVVKYIDYHQSIGMRFQVDAGMLRAFHRQTGDVDLAAVAADQVAAFLQPRHQVTSTWRMKHRALRRFRLPNHATRQPKSVELDITLP